jgi:hypothetical protein
VGVHVKALAAHDARDERLCQSAHSGWCLSRAMMRSMVLGTVGAGPIPN